MAKKLSHVGPRKQARMVDVGGKRVTRRRARARGSVRLHRDTVRLLAGPGVPKGSVIETARLAGIQAAKRTDELIPLCHALQLTHVDVACSLTDQGVDIEATVEARGRTGVEMEALTAVAVAALTVYDICKAVDRGASIEAIRLMEKSGGRSGHYRRRE